MAPVLESVVSDYAELSDLTAKLVLRDASRRGRGVVVRADAETGRPCSREMGQRREKLASAYAPGVRDGAVGSTVEFQPRHVGSARIAKRLVGGVDGLDSRWIAAVRTGIASTGIQGEGGEFHAHDGIASKHVGEAASVAMAGGEQPASVDAKLRTHVVDQIVDKPDIVHAQV